MSYSDFILIEIALSNNYCYTAILIEKGTNFSLTNFSCFNNNNNDFAMAHLQEFGSCLDLKNTRNSSIQNFIINGCFSYTTTCGLKVFLEIEKERKSLYNEVLFFFLLKYFK